MQRREIKCKESLAGLLAIVELKLILTTIVILKKKHKLSRILFKRK